jgi:hypothetical protein
MTKSEVELMVEDQIAPMREANRRLREQLGILTPEEQRLREKQLRELEQELGGSDRGAGTTNKESLDQLADIFVGPKLPKDADPQLREARKHARKVFREGRAGAL